jgi:hypothetical protein
LLLTPSAIRESILVVETNRSTTQLINFLQKELAVSATSIAMALRLCEQDPGPLHMILWQYGLVSLEQLEQIFDWLEG